MLVTTLNIVFASFPFFRMELLIYSHYTHVYYLYRPCSEEDCSTRLSAAKSFFEAFANRSQAYNFHHSMGLTVFNRKVDVVQPLTKIYEFFRVCEQVLLLPYMILFVADVFA